jgi:Flp pilus assembly pilin Flp
VTRRPREQVRTDARRCSRGHAFRDRRDQSGAAAVEMAIILPVLVLLMFGIVEFGLAFNRLQGVHAAAREGARVGAVSPGDECARALSALDGLGVSAVTCIVEESCPGDRAVVVIGATEEVSIPMLGDRSVSLSGRGEFRCEL